MSLAKLLTTTFGAGGEMVGGPVNLSVGGDRDVSVTIPDNTAAQALGVAFAVAKLRFIFIEVSSDCTLKVNSSSVPDQTISLTPTASFCWIKESGIPYPFQDNTGAPIAVTELYVTTPNATPDVAVDLELRSGVDL